MSQEACRAIIERLMNFPRPTKEDVNAAKLEVARETHLTRVPSNSELIRYMKPGERDRLRPVLRRKEVRTISGVSVVAVMTKPYPCPKTTPCAYCPGGPPYGVPQSYTGHEPAALRGVQNDFDPYQQVKHRIEQLEAIGHSVDKVELIIMGGTFPAMPPDYQEYFVRQCLNAIIQNESCSLGEAKSLAETSRIHNVGITVETRPDWSRHEHVDSMLTMGVTRVELGVQNIYDDVYELVERGHSVQDVVDATHILKDSGLKVAYHLMPGLPGSNFRRDLAGFRRIFADASFKPDMIKVYPCLVLKGTETYKWWKKGTYQPYTTEEAVQLILEVKKMIPPWVRIMRVQRDIPAYLIEAGVDRSNLRQLVLRRLKKHGIRCRCIRCREVGHRWLKERVKPKPENVQVHTHIEEASEGEDVFISVEDSIDDVLVGYLRLRIPSEKVHRSEISSEATSIVRELRVYGPMVPVGKHSTGAWQHKGYGGVLLSEAERISKENYDCRKVVVTSALGTKKYYENFGYDYDGPYVSKVLS